MLDVGQSEDWIALQVVIMPCLVGYRDIARKIHDDPKTVREGNRYWKWVLNYVSNDFSSAVNKATGKYRPSEQLNRYFNRSQIHSTRGETCSSTISATNRGACEDISALDKGLYTLPYAGLLRRLTCFCH